MSTTVWHGTTCNISPYTIVQHRYGLKEYEYNSQGQGYVELLEISDGLKDKPFVVHLFLNHEGSSYFVYNNFEFAKLGYQHCLGKGFVRSRDLWLSGSLSWAHTGQNLPWFYAETKEDTR